MTTKDQERKALERMKKIVAELGEQSYIGTAFEGAWELAEQNIEWDAAFSVTNSLECANRDVAKYKADALEAREQLKAALTESKIAIGRAEEMERVTDSLRQQIHNLDADLCRTDSECMKWQKKAEDGEQEIVRLKAMLFDLMYSKQIAG